MEKYSLDVQGHQLNSLSNYHLQDVISMSIAERVPFERARDAYYHSLARVKYNHFVENVGLLNYRIPNDKTDEILSFTQDEVESVIQENLSRVKSERQREFDEIEKSWSKNSNVFYENLKEEDPNQFFNWALKEVEKNNTFGWLTGIILSSLGGLFLLYLVFYFLYGHSPIEFLGWIIEPFQYFLSGNTPYDGYYTAVLMFFLGFIFLSCISLIVILPLNRKLFITPKLEHLARKKANQVAKKRFSNSKELLKVYQQKDFSEFFDNNVFQQLIPSAIPTDYYNQICIKYRDTVDSMAKINNLENSFSKDIFDTVFEQYRNYREAISEYNRRFDDGSSMLAILPKSYHNSESLSVIWKLLNEGRADTWKESVNLMRTDAFQDSMLSAIRNVYQSIDNLSSQLYYEGQRLRETLEHSIELQQSHFDSIESSNRHQNNLIAKNNELIETQNIITSNLLITELIKK